MVQSNVFDVQESLLRHYWQVVRKRWWMIGVVFSLIVITVLIDTVRTRPLYQATMRLLIERENSDIISFDEAVGRKPVIDPAVSYSSYYQTQYEILQSRSLARRVIRTLQLQSHPEFTSAQETPGITQTLKGLPSSLLGTLLRWLPQPDRSENGNTTSATAGSAKPDPEAALVDSVLARLHIKPIPDTRLVEVSFAAHNPELAADAANMLARIYIDQNLEMRFSASQGAVDWLHRRVQDMRQKVETAELALQRYKEANDIVSLEARQTVVVQQLAELNSAHTAAKTEFIGVETLYQGMQRFSEHPEMIESIPSVVNNSLIQSLKENHATLQQTAAELEQRWGPKHPGMIQLRSQMATMQRKIRMEVLNVVRGIETDHEIAQSRIAALRNAFEQKKQEAQRLNQKAIQYGVLKREAESNQQLYESRPKGGYWPSSKLT